MIIRYENFVQQPEEQLRRICKFVDIRHRKKRASSVVSSSIGKNEAPDIPANILEACSGLLDRLNDAEEAASSRQS